MVKDEVQHNMILMGEAEIRIRIREGLKAIDTQLNDCDLETVAVSLSGLKFEVENYLGSDKPYVPMVKTPNPPNA